MKTVELVVPCYNEEECVSLFYVRVKQVFELLKDYDFIITYIDDGSIDGTLAEIKKTARAADQGRVQYISFSRRGEPKIRSFFARAFYYLIKRVTVIDLVPGATDYRLMKRKMVEAIVSMTERERFTKGIYSWVGFRNKWIEYENVERVAGRTKWSIRGLFSYAYHGFIAFATTPLRAVIYLGMWIVLFAVAYAVFVFISALISQGERKGYASILIVMLLLGGIIITILGMIGEYLARIYIEVKKRPIYFERESYFEYDIKENEDEG